MKTIWNALAVVAVANLLALGAFVGWLVTSDRLDAERLRELRATLSTTITQVKADQAAAQAKAEEEARQAEAARRAAQPPLTAEQRVAARLEAGEIDRQRVERLRREVEDLRSMLQAERDLLDRDRAAFLADRDAWTTATAAQRQQLDDEQFVKTLGVLSALKAKEAVTLLRQMISGETPVTPSPPAANASASTTDPVPPSGGIQQVVAYLDAMDEQPRTKIISELARTDPALATDLLERLRHRAQFASVPRPAP